MRDTPVEKADRLTDAPTLVAIAQAGHRTGDRDIERAARRLLREEHGIEVRFLRELKEVSRA